jgi:hypothetical protein
MLVERMTWEAKPGCREELIEWCRRVRDLPVSQGVKSRIYSTLWGNWNTVILELESETQEDMNKYWAGVGEGGPEYAENEKTLWELVAPGHTNEMLRVE